MSTTKEIIVVAPDQYRGLARKLAHRISKTNGCNGAFWNIKQFEGNEFQLGGNRYAIFMGNPDENPLTKDFLLVTNEIKNQAGACFGFDGTKAVVFGEGKLKQMEEFKEVHKKIAATLAGLTVGATIAMTFVAFLPIAWILAPYLLRKNIQKRLRAEQTKAALTLFLTEHFDNWAGLTKEENAE